MFVKRCGVMLALAIVGCPAYAQKITVTWDKIQGVSKTVPTLQVVVNPPLAAGFADCGPGVCGSEAAGRGLCAVCALATVSEAGCGGARGAGWRAKRLGTSR